MLKRKKTNCLENHLLNNSKCPWKKSRNTYYKPESAQLCTQHDGFFFFFFFNKKSTIFNPLVLLEGLSRYQTKDAIVAPSAFLRLTNTTWQSLAKSSALPFIFISRSRLSHRERQKVPSTGFVIEQLLGDSFVFSGLEQNILWAQ